MLFYIPCFELIVIGVSGFGRLGEVEAAGDDGLDVDDYHLIMGNAVLSVNPGFNTILAKKPRESNARFIALMDQHISRW